MPEIVDPPQGVDAGGALVGSPLEGRKWWMSRKPPALSRNHERRIVRGYAFERVGDRVELIAGFERVLLFSTSRWVVDPSMP